MELISRMPSLCCAEVSTSNKMKQMQQKPKGFFWTNCWG